jgi:hypothetical protein
LFEQDTNRTVAGQRVQTMSPPPKKMEKDKNRKDQPIASFNKEECEDIWDDLYMKEEGVVLEFDFDSKIGKIKSLKDNNIYIFRLFAFSP